MAVEFRVRWRRDGRQSSYRIYQSWGAAYGKAQRVLAVEQIRDDSERFETLPPLVEGPFIQERQVGDWEDKHTPSQPHDGLVERMRRWADDYTAPLEPETEPTAPF